MKYFLQRTSDLVLISKPYARSGRMVPFYFPVKNARNERPLSPETVLHYAALVQTPEDFLKKLKQDTGLKNCWSPVVASVCLLENAHLAHNTKKEWADEIVTAFESLLSNGIACTRASSILHELCSDRVETVLKEAILSYQNSERMMAASKCVVSIEKEECLFMLDQVLTKLSIEGLTYIARELSKSPLEKSIKLLWRLIEKPEIYKDALRSLVAKIV